MSTATGPIPEGTFGDRRETLRAHARSPLTVLDLLTLLSHYRRFLAKAALAGTMCGLALAFLLPVQYTAVTTVLPTGGSSSLASAFAAQSGELGLLAGIAGNSLGFHNPADVCLLMLRSRSVEDAVIQRFQLMKEYREKRLSDTRTALERRTSVTLNLKSGVIAISARDRDPARAAELANGYVDEFRKFTASLAITEASQRRLFFEQQLLEARSNLTEADDAFKNTEQNTGMLDPASTATASLESAVAIRAQIAAREVELRTMRTYSTEQNPALVRIRQELAGLQTQLAEISGTSHDVVDDPLVPKDKIPEAGAEYLRRMRDVKYNEAVVAVLAKQLEIARLDEARQGPVVQVVDPAVMPDKRSSPKRLVTVFASTMVAFCFACLWVVYAKRESQTLHSWTVVNATIVLLVLLASAPLKTAQAQEFPAQPSDCTFGAGGFQEHPCAIQDQNAPGIPARLTSLDDRSTSPADAEHITRNDRDGEGRTAASDGSGNSARHALTAGPMQPEPEKMDSGVVRAIRDWGQIIAPLALTTLAISSVVN